MLYGSETWRLSQNDIGILNTTGKAMDISMCGVKLMDKKSTKDLMQMLDFNDTVDQLTKYNSVLRKDNNNLQRRALDIKVYGTVIRGRS